MMVRYFAALALMLWPSVAFAAPEPCRISSTANEEIQRLLDEHGYDFKGYDQLCQFLKARDLKIQISGADGVLAGRAYGWATVRFEDRRTGIRSDLHSSTTTLNSEPDTPTAKLSLWRSLNGALEDIAARTESMMKMADDVAMEKTRIRQALATATAETGARP